MIFARSERITPTDLELAVPPLDAEIQDMGKARGLTARQREILRLVVAKGAVARGQVMARFSVSGEAARRDFVALMRAGVLQRAGHGRRSHYRAIDR